MREAISTVNVVRAPRDDVGFLDAVLDTPRKLMAALGTLDG